MFWARERETGQVTPYGDVRLADDLQFSVYNFEAADVEKAWKHFDLYESECKAMLESYREMYHPAADEKVAKVQQALDKNPTTSSLPGRRFPILGAYDLCLKCSHLFNILDARGAISTTERAALINRVRQLTCKVAAGWLEQRGLEAAAESGAAQ